MKDSLVLVVGFCLVTVCCHHSVPSNLSSKVTAGATIEAIDVIGNSRISSETSFHGLLLRPDDRVSLPEIKSDIQYLYSLGFKEVRVEEEMGTRGRVVVFHAREKLLPQKLVP